MNEVIGIILSVLFLVFLVSPESLGENAAKVYKGFAMEMFGRLDKPQTTR